MAECQVFLHKTKFVSILCLHSTRAQKNIFFSNHLFVLKCCMFVNNNSTMFLSVSIN